MPDLCLAIEISNPSAGSAAPGTGPGVAAGRVSGTAIELLGVELLAASRRHDDDLLPAIDRLFRRLGRAPRDLKRVAVSVGPGGFTSLRMAVAAAKMICEATGAAAAAVPSARVVARRAGVTGPFAVALASKDDTAFVTRFASTQDQGQPGSIVAAADLDQLGVRTLIADRFLPPALRERAASLGMEVTAPVFDPAACLECAADAPGIDPMDLAPLYPRLPEAVIKWRALHPGQ